MKHFIVIIAFTTFLPVMSFNSGVSTKLDWKSYLSGARLTYVNSNYSSGYGGGGATITVDLCRNGYFHYHSESSVYVPDAGGYGTASDTHIYGSWDIIQHQGSTYLHGKSTQGEENFYKLQMGQGGKIYVQGAVYHVQRGRARC